MSRRHVITCKQLKTCQSTGAVCFLPFEKKKLEITEIRVVVDGCQQCPCVRRYAICSMFDTY